MGNKNRNNQHSSGHDSNARNAEKPDKYDKLIELRGVVNESLPAANFKVQVEGGAIIHAVLSGKMKINKIRVLPGDKVLVEVSPYDLTRGRISRRF